MRHFRQFECHRRRVSRRGVAVIVALGLLAITLTVSYTLLRTQSTSRLIAANASRSQDARQAALAGIQIALKEIHKPNWHGVAVPLTGSITATDSYQVAFLTGDSTLTAGDEDYQEYPYRLTLRSTGTSVDPTDPNRRAEHTIEVVVQLVRERLASPSAAWNELTENTLTQWDDSTVEINFPCRIEGPVRLNGTLDFSPQTPPLVRPFDGLIDEVAIVNNSLTAAELTAIYNGTASYTDHLGSILSWWKFDEASGALNALDQKGKFTGIYEGATTGNQPSPFGGSGSARFDGEVDGISLGMFDIPSTAMTLMAWIKVDDFGSPEARIISKSNGTAESNHWWMLSTVDSGGQRRLRFRLKNVLGGTTTQIATSGNLPTGQWLFVAATFDGLTMKLFVNGTLAGSQLNLSSLGTNKSVPVWIGDNASGSPRGLYFRHMKQMIGAGYDDLRPFNGPLTLRTNTLREATRSLLSGELGIEIIDDPSDGVADYSRFSPPTVSGYQLYPGGVSYTIPAVGATLAGEVMEADVITNPLGVFRAKSDVQLQSHVTIRGVLLGAADVDLGGSSIELKGVDLPPLRQSSERVQLPCLCVGRRLEFLADSQVRTEGMIVVAEETRFKSDDATMTASLTGCLATAELRIEPRSPWASFTELHWNSATLAFEQQRRNHGGIPYLPAYIEKLGLSSNPHFQIVPPSDTIRFHWHDWSQPLFLPQNDGDGLRWNIVRWNDQG